jgi:nucleoside-diphosphate-sugar epimerase
MSENRKTALVVGATGVIGRALTRHFDGRDDWEVIAASRRPPGGAFGGRHVSVDLMDRDDCGSKLGAFGEVTHLFYAAYTDRPGWAAQCGPNAAMFENALDAVEASASGLRRVVLMQGTKYYGCHLGPFKTPAREDDPRHEPPNFYFNQQDDMMARQRGKAWSWVCLRPHTVCGQAIGMPLNLLSVVSVFAAISKELGLPLCWPGKPKAFHTIFQLTDAALLAQAAEWSAIADAAANEAFNITNGDYFRWEHLWPQIAEAFDMTAGEPRPIDLIDMMRDKADLWSEMVQRHGLRETTFADAANWAFGNYVFGNEWDILSATTKARGAGFHECLDSEMRFVEQLRGLRAEKFVP